MTNKVLNGTDKLNLNAKEKVYISNLSVDGTKKPNSNAKIFIDCSELVIKDSVIENGCTAYNVFEQRTSQFNLSKMKVDNLVCDDVPLKHNVLSFYNIADDAEILIQNSTFNLDVNNSNIIRLANYKNASNVTVTFKNVEWNYENSPEGGDWSWAGLLLFQPASGDKSLTGDMSYLETWTFVFDNCKYNGEKITANNFGEHKQAFILYNVNKSGIVEDPTLFNLNIQFI
jgi:hypothetical protein